MQDAYLPRVQVEFLSEDQLFRGQADRRWRDACTAGYEYAERYVQAQVARRFLPEYVNVLSVCDDPCKAAQTALRAAFWFGAQMYCFEYRPQDALLRVFQARCGSRTQAELTVALLWGVAPEVQPLLQRVFLPEEYHRAWQGVLIGASAVARLIAFLLVRDFVVHLSTVREDTHDRIDVFASWPERGRKGLCFQVKGQTRMLATTTASLLDRTSVDQADKQQRTFLLGVANLQGRTGVKWTPIWLDVALDPEALWEVRDDPTVRATMELLLEQLVP